MSLVVLESTLPKLSFRAPDSSPVKKKMIYAGSKDALTRALEGIMVKVAGTDRSEVTENILEESCRRLG